MIKPHCIIDATGKFFFSNRVVSIFFFLLLLFALKSIRPEGKKTRIRS